MKKILVGNTVSEKCENTLKKMGYVIVKLPPFEKLQSCVASHADMLIFFDGNKIITHIDYYSINKKIFDSLGIEIQTTDEAVSNMYPKDILFNAVLTKNKVLFSKTASTSKYISNLAEKKVNVKQGYTACSTCRVTDNAFITTDKGLYDAYTANGIDALPVEKEGIDLPGYDCGFIGGASAVLDDFVCFFGDIKEHTDYIKINSFIEKHGKKAVSLSDEKLTDVGGAVVI